MLKHLLTVCCLSAFATPFLLGQALPTAKRTLDLQVGGSFVLDNSDYNPSNLKGFGFYISLDRTSHWGGEAEFHQANSNNGDSLYQRTYEIGPRYHRDYGRFAPYLKAEYGRGVFNFPNNVANLAYNMFAFAGGTDFKVKPWLNVRAEYQYQDWLSFPPQGLNPQLITIGVAYHFPGELHRGRHW